MRIIVPIKQVPETSEVKMDEKTGTMIREGVISIINPLDLYAIEEAILLKEQMGGEIIVVSMGPAKAIEAIKEAIAMGCDEGYLVSDRKFAGADTWATSYVLAKAIEQIGSYDLILCGERATDGDTGQVGPGIASFLNLPVISYVSELQVQDDQIQAKRLVENGYEVYQSPMPVLLTVVKEISYPRLPTLRGKQKAKKIQVPVWDNQQLKLEEQFLGLNGSPTRVVKIFHPKITRQGERLVVKTEEEVSAAADRIVQYLETNNLL
ncbi:MAG: electron transfer flavoprotein subunit beta/FixA family protein [Candidatus Delongbacteria bacterium]|nr:electron transfer flavoprotein subunit beta/FixA family protein [Candidatus Delongbacteria bacterium]